MCILVFGTAPGDFVDLPGECSVALKVILRSTLLLRGHLRSAIVVPVLFLRVSVCVCWCCHALLAGCPLGASLQLVAEVPTVWCV